MSVREPDVASNTDQSGTPCPDWCSVGDDPHLVHASTPETVYRSAVSTGNVDDALAPVVVQSSAPGSPAGVMLGGLVLSEDDVRGLAYDLDAIADRVWGERFSDRSE